MFLPYNLVKAGINGTLTMLLYKPVVRTLRRAKLLPPAEREGGGNGKRTVLTTVIAVLMIAVSLLVFFLVLGGKISIGIDK